MKMPVRAASLGAKEATFQDMDGLRRISKMLSKKWLPGREIQSISMQDDGGDARRSFRQFARDVISNLSIAKAKDKLSPHPAENRHCHQTEYRKTLFALRGWPDSDKAASSFAGQSNPLWQFTSSPEYALKQIEAYDQQRERIHRGIPKSAYVQGAGTPPAGANVFLWINF